MENGQPLHRIKLKQSIDMKKNTSRQHPSGASKVAFGKDSWQNTMKEKGHDKDGDKKVKIESDKVAEKPRRYKLTGGII